MSFDSRDDCIASLALARKAEGASSYINDIIDNLKKELINNFIETKVEFDEDFDVLIMIKRRFDALLELKATMNSHINQGKVAEKMIDKFDR